MKNTWTYAIKKIDSDITCIRSEKRKAVGRRLGAARKGRKNTTQQEKDEIANYLKRNPT